MAVNARSAVVALAGVATAVMTSAAPAHADTVAYLVNVTVRPGYNFPNADAALSYGYGLCDRVAQGIGYQQLVGGVMNDFNTGDDYQGVYIINQAVNELCPALIWQLRQSAVHYRGQAAS